MIEIYHHRITIFQISSKIIPAKNTLKACYSEVLYPILNTCIGYCPYCELEFHNMAPMSGMPLDGLFFPTNLIFLFHDADSECHRMVEVFGNSQVDQLGAVILNLYRQHNKTAWESHQKWCHWPLGHCSLILFFLVSVRLFIRLKLPVLPKGGH